MSDFSVLLSRLRTELMQKGVRYKQFTTTSAVASDGTTIVSTALTELDDWWNSCQAVLLDANQEASAVRTVEDFTASSDTLTFTNNPFNTQVASGVVVELYEPGTWRGEELKRFLLLAAEMFLKIVPEEMLTNFGRRETIGGVTGVVDTPAKVLRFVEPVIVLDGKAVGVLRPEEAAYLDEGAYINATGPNRYTGYFANRASGSTDVGQFRYAPKTNVSAEWHYVPVPEFDSSENWKVPEEAWGAVLFGAAQLALTANERVDLAKHWEAQMLKYLPGKDHTKR